MSPIRLLAAALVLALAACGTTPGATAQGGSPLIDVPVAPFPYNSRFCT